MKSTFYLTGTLPSYDLFIPLEQLNAMIEGETPILDLQVISNTGNHDVQLTMSLTDSKRINTYAEYAQHKNEYRVYDCGPEETLVVTKKGQHMLYFPKEFFLKNCGAGIDTGKILFSFDRGMGLIFLQKR